jgi:uncharacterized peroxidase-related enzyme
MAHIKVIDYESSSDRLKDIYDDIIKKRGKLAEVHKIQSLNPETIVQHMELYMGVMFGQSPLTRAEREMIAVVVSVANGCAYCTKHHQEALNAYWKDWEKVTTLGKDFRNMDISLKLKELCSFAFELTQNPKSFEGQDKLMSLRNAGFDDRAILDTTLVISYFNFVNRMVLSLGVELESDSGSGYKY